MKRMTMNLAALSAAALATTTTLLGSPSLASASPAITTATVPAASFDAPCVNTAPTGYIGQRWYAAGGYGSIHGCPTSLPYRDQNGLKQRFRNGQIAWSPSQGPAMTVRAYEYQNRVVFRWESTAPFNYDYFNVRWSFGTGGSIPTNQQYTYRGPSRTSGAVNIAIPTINSIGSDGNSFDVTLIVEGCDNGGFPSSSTCRQGWTIPLRFRV